MWNRIADIWCNKMHTEAMWPIHGKYVCSRCLREHALEWEVVATSQQAVGLPQASARVAIEPRVWLTDQR